MSLIEAIQESLIFIIDGDKIYLDNNVCIDISLIQESKELIDAINNKCLQ